MPGVLSASFVGNMPPHVKGMYMSVTANAFDVGDYVVYPKHGVGRVIELQEQEIAAVQDPRSGQEQPGQPGQVRVGQRHGHRHHRGVKHGCGGCDQPVEADRPGRRGLLAEQIPAGVSDRGYADQGNGCGAQFWGPAGSRTNKQFSLLYGF